MNKRKILYITGSRADYGLMRQCLFAIKSHSALKLEIVVTGMHLMDQFGRTMNEIKKDKFKIHVIQAKYEKDDKESMASFVGEFVSKLSEKMKYIKPDIILILGDRAEMLGAAIVGTYFSIPVAHIHGGDVSSTVDDTVRHAITKLSHIHFPATRKSAERIIKMCEEKNRVFITGAPGLDDILTTKYVSPNVISRKYGLDLSKPYLIVVQHPVTSEIKMAASQMRQTMEAIKELGYQSIVIYPNADAGGREMIKVIKKYKKHSFIKIFKNINHQDYIGLLQVSGAIIGNSSGGIIETASFHLPAINIGIRQRGRERAENVIDVDYNKRQIKTAIKKALFYKNFKKKAARCKNPYGNGYAGKKIANVLSKIKIDKNLLQK